MTLLFQKLLPCSIITMWLCDCYKFLIQISLSFLSLFHSFWLYHLDWFIVNLLFSFPNYCFRLVWKSPTIENFKLLFFKSFITSFFYIPADFLYIYMSGVVHTGVEVCRMDLEMSRLVKWPWLQLMCCAVCLPHSHNFRW